jgi:hypothetical protein
MPNENAETQAPGTPKAEAHYSMAGLLYTPVELGTIRIGAMREVRGRNVPVKHDHFSITTLVRRDGQWINHVLQEQLQAAIKDQDAVPVAERKLRSIPVRVQFDDPSLTMRSRLEAFDTNLKRPVCASSGKGVANRLLRSGEDTTQKEVTCEGPEACAFARSEGISCKFFGRVSLQIEGQGDQENAFLFRSTSFNTLRNLEARLWRYWAILGRRLSGVPFNLVLRTRTTAGSKWTPLFFLDLQLKEGVSLAQAAKMAKEHADANQGAGLDVAGYEAVIAQG